MSCINLYRNVCIAEKMLNSLFSSLISPGLLFSNVGGQVLSGFVTMTRYGFSPMPQFLMFPIIWINAIEFNLLVTTISSYLHVNSSKFRDDLLRKQNFKLRFYRKLVRTQIKACHSMKIQFGSNFIDSGTPLVNQNFAWNQTASLMLLYKSQ